MQVQYEMPLLAAFGKPKDEPSDWVKTATFEQCVVLAFERGQSRYPQKMLGRLAGVYTPHVSDVALGKRPLKAQCVHALCWLSGCNAPTQWLDLQREAIEIEAETVAKEATWQQVRKVAA